MSGAEYRSVGKLTMPLHVPSVTGGRGEHLQAQRELVAAIGDRDHVAAYYKAFAVLMSRRLHPLRDVTGVVGLRNIMVMDVPESVRRASPLHAEFPDYVGRKVADSVTTEMRSLATVKPNSPFAELVRERDDFVTSTYLQPTKDGKRLPQGTEAAQIAAGLAGTYLREPASEDGKRGFITYMPSGLVYGTVEKNFEGYLQAAAYTMTPPAVSPFAPESELGIYGGQYDFLMHEVRDARRLTEASMLGIAATQHLQ